MTPIIDKLVAEGFINRFQDPNDRRVIRVEPTETAREFLREQETKLKSRLLERISPLSDEDLEELDKCISSLNKLLLKI